jgi:polyhydroxybutyrate depolymerase
VVSYYIFGLGHHWPGGTIQLPEILVGKAVDQVDAIEIIWDFFQKHPKSK